MLPLQLISDANVLIDIDIGGLSEEIFQLPFRFALPDVLYEEELKTHHQHFLQMGLEMRSLTPESIVKAHDLVTKYGRPSRNDLFALCLAIQEKATLLTGDKPLRNAAEDQKVDCHGVIWLIKQMLSQKIINSDRARQAFEKMISSGSRLPQRQINDMLSKFL